MNFSEGDFELKEIQRLEGHTGKVLGIAWKQDTGIWGRPLAIASWSDDKTVRIWEENFSGILECKAVLEESHGRSVRSCAWSPPCKLLAVACSDATTAIWKNVGNAYERVYTLEGHDNEVRSVSWNTKGDLLATCGGDKSVWIWEVLPGNEFDCASVLHEHTKDVKMVQWHEDMLFSCSYDNTIKVWEEICGGGDWACIQTLGESDSDDLTIQIWNCESENDYVGSKLIWTHACTLSGYHDRTVFSVDWLREMIRCLPEGQEDPGIFASAGADNAIRLFIENKDNEVDGLTFKLLLKKEKAHEMNISSVKWKAGLLSVVEPHYAEGVHPNPLGGEKYCFYKDRRLLASASDDGTVKIWELVCPWPAGAS